MKADDSNRHAGRGGRGEHGDGPNGASSNSHPYHPPHKLFGRQLKTMRQKLQESLGEVSGAVEIAVEQLDRYERGAELPNEDILMLLICHFNLGDDEAVALWELAGYDLNDRRLQSDRGDDAEENQQNNAPVPVMMITLDNRVLYTNHSDVVGDEAGLVINFMQSDGNKQRYPVSRVGMSYEQAAQLVQNLQRALMHRKYLSGPKQLPPTAGGQ